jgi:hypothetical protein
MTSRLTLLAERDLTEYSALLRSASTARAELGNLVDSTYTSTLFGTAELAKVGQSGSQRYFSTDPQGHCYSRALTAAGGLLTAIVDGAGCDDH